MIQYVSSDTNVWIDYAVIKRLELPFRLPYTYLMEKKTIAEDLISLGINPTILTEDEEHLERLYSTKYKRLTSFDRSALAIAKNRGIILLTGDLYLRKAALRENVQLLGSIGILDQLYQSSLISAKDYEDCLREFLSHSLADDDVRLPINELQNRLKNLIELGLL